MATAPRLFWPFSTDLVTEWPGASSMASRPHHFGTDFGVPQGTPVPATIDGTVVRVGDDGRGAWCIDILRADGLLIRGGHFSRMDVRPGQVVVASQIIGLSGGRPGSPGAGLSTGEHYHWEGRRDRLWSGGRWVDPRTLHPSTLDGVIPGPVLPSPMEVDMKLIRVEQPTGITWALIGLGFFQESRDEAQANAWAEVWGDSKRVSDAAWDQAFNAALLGQGMIQRATE